MSHTPGPWVAAQLDRQNRMVAFDGGYICRLFSPDSSIVGMKSLAPPIEQAIANARLIAAAPDLLAACKLAIEFIDTDGPRCLNSYGVARRTIESIIAKAEGNG